VCLLFLIVIGIVFVNTFYFTKVIISYIYRTFYIRQICRPGVAELIPKNRNSTITIKRHWTSMVVVAVHRQHHSTALFKKSLAQRWDTFVLTYFTRISTAWSHPRNQISQMTRCKFDGKR